MTDSGNFTFHDPYLIQSNPWARISEIAARVGVQPHVKKGVATIMAEGADGQMYDVFEVVSAVLDKIDSATKQARDGT